MRRVLDLASSVMTALGTLSVVLGIISSNSILMASPTILHKECPDVGCLYGCETYPTSPCGGAYEDYCEPCALNGTTDPDDPYDGCYCTV